jgi:hypothetical protein
LFGVEVLQQGAIHLRPIVLGESKTTAGRPRAFTSPKKAAVAYIRVCRYGEFKLLYPRAS